MEFIKQLIANPEQLFLLLTAIIGGASLIAKGIQVITGITPSTKDDEYANKLVKAIAWLQALLSKIALNPK